MTINCIGLTLFIGLFFTINLQAQLLIGKNTVDGSVLVDFAPDTTNGIVLSHVENVDIMQNVAAGTMVFEKTSKKFKYYDGIDWVTMNKEEGILSNEIQVVENNVNQGVIIGNDISDVNGVLILESADKALVLPKISNPAKNVPSPYPGMICLDTISNNLYFFNGSVWEFWGY